MRMPPKTGTVSKLSGNRRKPWCAKRFVGYKVDDEKKTVRPVYQSIGTFAKKSDAIRALMKAQEPVDSTITLEKVYDEWSERKFENLSKTMRNSYTNAWSYLDRLHRIPIAELKVSDFELIVERNNAPRTVRKVIQILLNGLYDYAIAHDYCTKNVSDYTDFRGDNTPRIVRKVFTPSVVKKLLRSEDVKDQMIAVGCYTGMRPSELIALKRSEVDFDTGFLRIAGSKSKSGHFRSIPIHADILPLIQLNCLKSAKFEQIEVFLSDRHKRFGYDAYADHVAKHGHTPHDTRHTFVTYAKKSDMDSLAVKRIVGHASNGDITETVYTHLDDAFLQREMEKFRVE